MDRGRASASGSGGANSKLIDYSDQVAVVKSPDGDVATEVADLFIRTHDGQELYFEIKTATPNKDTSKSMKRFILRVGAICKGKNVQAFAATAYNPYGEGNFYKWNYARQFLEVGHDLLIGSEFWNRIGDETPMTNSCPSPTRLAAN